MDTMIVQNKSQLVAAIKAGAQTTFELAKKNPFEVQLGKTKYTFKDGLHERRSRAIIKNIHRTPARAFDTGETAWTM